MSSRDPREAFLSDLRRELRWRPVTRRRVIREIGEHFDDLVAELQASGLSEDAAPHEAGRRIGDPVAIAAAYRSPRPSRRRRGSPAWIAVAAMSLVTAWATELPQASGAKATARTGRLAQSSRRPLLPARHPRRQLRSTQTHPVPRALP